MLIPFILDQLHPLDPILSWTFSNFLALILGRPFLLPQRANYEKGEFSQLQKRMRQTDEHATAQTPILLPAIHIALTGSVYAVVAVAVERYIIICNPYNWTNQGQIQRFRDI